MRPRCRQDCREGVGRDQGRRTGHLHGAFGALGYKSARSLDGMTECSNLGTRHISGRPGPEAEGRVLPCCTFVH